MNIQEQTASEIKRTTLDMGKTAAGAVRNTTEAAFNISIQLINLIRAVAQNRKTEIVNGETTLDKMQRNVEKGDCLTSVTVADEDIEFYKSAMQKEKIPYVVLDINNDDCKNIIYMNSDSEKLKNVISLHQAKAGMVNEVAPEVFLRHIEDKNIGLMRNLRDNEFELFREAARDKGLIFSFYRKDDRVTVIYNLKDKALVNGVRDIMSWEMTDRTAGAIIDRLTMNRATQRGLTSAIEEYENFYVVNAKDIGNYLTITREGLSYYKNGNKIAEIPRDNKYFADKVKEKFKGLQNSVMLSQHEFEQPHSERENTARIRYASYSYDIAKAVRKSYERMEKIISKMSIDDENENPAEIFDDGVSYSVYSAYENLSDSDREEFDTYAVHRLMVARENRGFGKCIE